MNMETFEEQRMEKKNIPNVSLLREGQWIRPDLRY
jgi:hypothetical protein